MDTETTEGEVIDTTNDTGEGSYESEIETISIPKSEWEKTNQTLGSLKREIKDLKKPKDESRETPKSNQQTTGQLDETALDYLDLKGVSDPDEISIIEKVIAKTGQTVREALKDDYVQSKLDSIRQEKAVKNATPSSTKRGGNQQGDIASALAKFEQTGELPDDFTLRTAVVNAKVESSNTNKPAWHK
jgi:hypothetical protein